MSKAVNIRRDNREEDFLGLPRKFQLYVNFILRSIGKRGPGPTTHTKCFCIDDALSNELFRRLKPGIILGTRYVERVTSLWFVPEKCSG